MLILELTKLIGLFIVFNYSRSTLSTNKFQASITNTSIKNTGIALKKVILNRNFKEKLQWWIKNLKICNGRSFIQSHSQVLVKTNAPRKRWDINRGKWSKEEQLLHIDFKSKQKFLIVVHFQIDSTTALLYLVKMGEQGAKCY